MILQTDADDGKNVPRVFWSYRLASFPSRWQGLWWSQAVEPPIFILLARMVPSPRISVILATYNGRDYLAECVNSVLGQDFQDFEFIVVDDGSTDGSDILLRELAAQTPGRIRIIRQENGGQAAAFNRGIAEARGVLVSFIDSDDFWYPGKLSRVAADFGDPAIVAIHQHNLRIVRGVTPTDEVFRPVLLVGDLLTWTIESKWAPLFVATAGLTFSRRALLQVGPIPHDFRTCADGFLTRTAMCFGRVSATDACLGAYRVHGSNHTFNNPGFNSDRYLRELLLPKLNAFYQLRSIPLTLPIRVGLSSDETPLRLAGLRVGEGERVLMIRSAPVDRVARVLSALFVINPRIQIDLLIQPGYEGVFSDPRIELLPLAGGPMRTDSIPAPVKQAIGRRDYAYVVIPYNEPDGRAYGNVHGAMLALPVTCPIVGVGCNGAVFGIESSSAQPSKEPDGSLFSPVPDWSKLRGRHAGRPGYIVCDPAWLGDSDFSRLGSEITFASDDVYSVFARSEWRPSYYTTVDVGQAVRRGEHTRRFSGMLLLPLSLRSCNCAGPRTLWYGERTSNVSLTRLAPDDRKQAGFAFSRDVEQGVHAGFSVFFQQLQLAFHMGIREIHWVGLTPSLQDGLGRKEPPGGNADDVIVAQALHAAREHFERDGGRFVLEPI